jgi:hypothetical protein
MPQESVRIIGFLKKRPDLTHEEFYEHWEKKHAPLVVPWIMKHGFISYMQVLNSLSLSSLFPSPSSPLSPLTLSLHTSLSPSLPPRSPPPQIHTTPSHLLTLPGALAANGCGQMEVPD